MNREVIFAKSIFIPGTVSILSSPIAYLKGIGPQRAELLLRDAGISTFGDLLEYYPFRHLDKTRIVAIRDLPGSTDFVQVSGRIVSVDIVGEKRSRRLVATLRDATGEMELVWFQAVSWMRKNIETGQIYRVFGKCSFYRNVAQMSHPELELAAAGGEGGARGLLLEPVYPSSEQMKARGLGGRQLGRFTWSLLQMIGAGDLPENLPGEILRKYQLEGRFDAIRKIHFPEDDKAFAQALRRLKFEELFLSQLRLAMVRYRRHSTSKGFVFSRVGDYFRGFYDRRLSFELTGAQKKVLREIRKDLASGHQMNRLLQGDVGSGKTVVALMSMLIAADNGFQSCLMAPTEILARQHLESLTNLLGDLPIVIRMLTGSTPAKEKKEVLAATENGGVTILIGTHAVIEDRVRFASLGLAIVDEQHKFGVAQRAKLWAKNTHTHPHILVMTATPIPRTLALTAYGDLDYSVMDELPPGRKEITTFHRAETHRPAVMDFIRDEIARGRQAYIIYPLIEESAKLDYENLMKGYEEVKAFFPEPAYYISMVHGRQKAPQKQENMDRFARNDTQIMVSTTVIEVGVNIPNATVMLIESAEKFGLPQLHQLRGRVGRGSEKSYCILLTGTRLGAEAKKRMQIMCETNDGFRIAEKDLEIRGPGDVEGTRQSGLLTFKLASLVDDRRILEEAALSAGSIVEEDPELATAANLPLRNYLDTVRGKTAWSKIS